MADILVQLNQAVDVEQATTNLKERHIGWAAGEHALVFKELSESSPDVGTPMVIPSLVGPGMGRRIAQAGHGFLEGQFVRVSGSTWVLAQADAAGNVASHMVANVPDANTFDVAGGGAWDLPANPTGEIFLSQTVAGAYTGTRPTSGVVQSLGMGDGSTLYLNIGGSLASALDLDEIVDGLNGREDLYALPKGPAGGDLTGTYPNPLVNELSGLGTTFAALNPVWKSNGLPFTPSNQVLSAAFKTALGPGILVDNYGGIYFTEDGGVTWSAGGYSVSNGSTTRDIAYGKINATQYGWVVCGDGALRIFVDIPANYNVNGVPLQAAWQTMAVAGDLADISYCTTQGLWVWMEQSAGFYYAATLAPGGAYSATTPRPNGVYLTGYTGGIFEEKSTGKIVYFERGTGRLVWSSTATVETSWVEVTLNDEPILKAIYPAMDDSHGVGAGVSMGDTSAFAGQVVLATTDVSNPGAYMMAEEEGNLPPLWDIFTDGHRWLGSTLNNAAPVLYRLFLGSIPAHRQIVAEKGLAVYGPTELVDLPNAGILGTDENGVVVEKTLEDLGGLSQVAVAKGGVAVGGGKTLNFIQGSNVTLTIVDQGDTVDITVASSGGGGGGSATLKYACTMKAGSQTGNVGLNSGDSTQWAAHGTILVPEGDVALVQGASKFAVICPQPVNNASFILAIYAWPDTGTTMTLVAQTAVNVMPGSSSWLEAVMTSAGVTLVGGKRYFFVVLWDGNGATLAGTTGANLNVQPYIAFRKNNMGVLTTAPATLVAEGELPQHFFGRVTV